jgi:hypothetical protein
MSKHTRREGKSGHRPPSAGTRADLAARRQDARPCLSALLAETVRVTRSLRAQMLQRHSHQSRSVRSSRRVSVLRSPRCRSRTGAGWPARAVDGKLWTGSYEWPDARSGQGVGHSSLGQRSWPRSTQPSMASGMERRSGTCSASGPGHRSTTPDGLVGRPTIPLGQSGLAACAPTAPAHSRSSTPCRAARSMSRHCGSTASTARARPCEATGAPQPAPSPALRR